MAGVSGGVGATTVATALGAVDCGRFTGRPVDVLACWATSESLVRAGSATQQITAAGRPRPVVVVTATGPGRLARPVAARIRLLEPHAAGVVVVPFVRRWRELVDPLAEVVGLQKRPTTELSRPVRRYAAALGQVRAALSNSSRRHTPPRAPARATSPAHPLGRT